MAKSKETLSIEDLEVGATYVGPLGTLTYKGKFKGGVKERKGVYEFETETRVAVTLDEKQIKGYNFKEAEAPLSMNEINQAKIKIEKDLKRKGKTVLDGCPDLEGDKIENSLAPYDKGAEQFRQMPPDEEIEEKINGAINGKRKPKKKDMKKMFDEI